MFKCRSDLLFAFAVFLLCIVAPAQPAAYPDKPIRIVVAYTPAGFEFIQRELTTDRVAEFFSGLESTCIDR